MPDCPGQEQLTEFALGRVDDAARQLLRRHVDSCPPCAGRVAEIRNSAETRLYESRVRTDRPVETPAEPDADIDDELYDPQLLDPPRREGILGYLGVFEVESILGRGGMGVVFKAFDPVLKRAVAIKLLSRQLASSPKARRRFLGESRAAAAINHPNVVTIHAIDEQRGVPYLVMELVHGRTLRARTKAEPKLQTADVLRIGTQIAAGLAAAHAQGVIHRDIKPTNIMLENGVERVKITDFGLARAAFELTEVTTANCLAGTPSYMAPEQIRGEDLDPRADLFALGCVLYSMYTGHSPFSSGVSAEILRKVQEYHPPPLKKLGLGVPAELSDLVEKLMQKAPRERYRSADEVHAVLNDMLSTVNQNASRTIRLERSASAATRLWRMAGAVCLSIALLVVAWRFRPTAVGRSPRPEGAPSTTDGDAHTDPGASEPVVPAATGSVVLTVAKDGSGQHASLQDALAEAGPGTRIEILDDATYQGPLLIELDSITIDAPKGAELVVQDAADLITVRDAGSVTIRGLRLRTSGSQLALVATGSVPELTLDRIKATALDDARTVLVFRDGAHGSAERPIRIRDCTIENRYVGLGLHGQDERVAHLVIEDNQFGSPGEEGVHITLEGAAENVTIAGNRFYGGLGGIHLEAVEPNSLQGIRIENNSFLRMHHWIGFLNSSQEQGDVQINANLILQSQEVLLNHQSLDWIAANWMRANWWERSGANPERHDRVDASSVADFRILSRDERDRDFLRPAPDSPLLRSAGPNPMRPYIGALPADTDPPEEAAPVPPPENPN